MEAQSRRRGRAGGGPTGRGGRGHFRGRGRGGGWGGGRIHNNWRGRGRGRGGENGAVGGDWGHNNRGSGDQYRNGKKMPLDIPEDEIDPLKLFVGNIRPNVNTDQLLVTLAPYANVTSAFIVKKTFKGPNYGFISLPSEEDVKKVMDLNNQDCYLSGSKLIFRPARKRIMPPGEEGFVRQPLPDRHYDLSPLDTDRPSIHVLVDDVLMNILEYLPLKKRIHCEIVCRRWQALLYVMFGSTTHLNLSENYLIENSLHVNKAMISKMLLLTGETLKSLSLSETDYTLKKKLFLIIAQLCPNLENLDLSNILILYFDNVKALKDCKDLKCFSAKMCFELNENSFKELILALPCLEKIRVSHTAIKGDCFNMLPEGLKELNISFCSQVSKENLRKVSKGCQNLEVLEIENLDADKDFLEELGVNCTNLRSLKIYPPWSSVELSNQIKVFTKLTSLKIVAATFELPNIADNVKDLEELHIQIKKETRNMVDFGKFTRLKNVVLISSPFREQELKSLEKCRNLHYVTIKSCENADQETIKRIVKGCPEIKHIKCPKVGIDIKFITDINEIMKNRPEPIKISINEGALPSGELLEAQYDTKKIEFIFVDHSLFDKDFDDEDDDEDLYDSDESFDHMDHFWLNGYDSDNSTPDYMYYGDNLDFIESICLGYGLHYVGYDSDSSF
ncbi:unnamed protein product [Meganyctiphanes norvegica]|uniref:RRM domain-containing protein n=1 Tax=Meganyctiphanes norvegica TaxID=48144 RepID=A0AAV2PJC9_MEGNR